MIRLILALVLACILLPVHSTAFQPTIYAGAGVPTAGGGGGSFTFVASASGSDDTFDTDVSTSSTLNVAAGDLLIAFVANEGTADASIAISDGTNSFTFDTGEDVTSNVAQATIYPLYKINASSNGTAAFTATFGSSQVYKRIVVLQYRPGGGETVTKDISGTRENPSDGVSITTGSFSTTGTDVVACGGVASRGYGSTWSNPAINSVAADQSAAEDNLYAWCRIVTSALTTVTGTATYSSNTYWAATAIAFKSE